MYKRQGQDDPIALAFNPTTNAKRYVGQGSDIGYSGISGNDWTHIAVDDGVLYVIPDESRNTVAAISASGPVQRFVYELDLIHSFPFGNRSGIQSGLGYDPAANRVYTADRTGSSKKLNVYDKSVASTDRVYVPFNIAGIKGPFSPFCYPRTVIVKGNRAYMVGSFSSSSSHGDAFYRWRVYSWPRLDYISNTFYSIWQLYTNLGVVIDDVAFFARLTSGSRNQLQELTTTALDRPLLGFETITLSANSATAVLRLMFVDGSYLYAKSDDSNVVRAYSTAGTGNKSEVTAQSITLDTATHTNVKLMFSDATHFYFGRGTSDFVGTTLTVDAYLKSSRARDSSKDFTVTGRGSFGRFPGASVHGDRVLLSLHSNQGVDALVRAI